MVPQTPYNPPSYFQPLPTIDFRDGDQRGIRLQSILAQGGALPEAWYHERWIYASRDEVGQKVTIRFNVGAFILRIFTGAYALISGLDTSQFTER